VRSVGQGVADWAHICAVKQTVKVPASATGSVLYHSFLACCLSTIVTNATTSAEGQLYVPHGTDHARADEIQVPPSTSAAYLLPPTSSSSASDSAPFFDAGIYAPTLDYFSIVRSLRTPVALSKLSRLALPTHGLG
jgi:tRNA-dihydrouridine synthase 1